MQDEKIKTTAELIAEMEKKDIIQHIHNRLEYDRVMDAQERNRLKKTLKILQEHGQ
jgi:hypothetical protein